MLDHVASRCEMQSLFGQSRCASFFVTQINVIFMRPLYEALCDCIINKNIWLLLTDICISNRDICILNKDISILNIDISFMLK